VPLPQALDEPPVEDELPAWTTTRVISACVTSFVLGAVLFAAVMLMFEWLYG
jgi:hypothetical protein